MLPTSRLRPAGSKGITPAANDTIRRDKHHSAEAVRPRCPCEWPAAIRLATVSPQGPRATTLRQPSNVASAFREGPPYGLTAHKPRSGCQSDFGND